MKYLFYLKRYIKKAKNHNNLFLKPLFLLLNLKNYLSNTFV